MATGLEDSLQSPLEYEAEVAYICLTSDKPPAEEEDEFDFSPEHQEEKPEPEQGSIHREPQTLPQDLQPAETLQPEALQPETLQSEALQAETLQAETVQAETLQPETPQAETVQAETLQTETPQAETVQAETVQAETPQPETVQAETVQAETLQAETPQTETPQAETLEPEILQAETQEPGPEVELEVVASEAAAAAEITPEKASRSAVNSELGRPPLMSKQTTPRPHPNPQPHTGEGKQSVPHYTLDTEGPATPTSKLHRIMKDNQATPSPKLRPKLQQHSYNVLVVYGSSGCGRTHLVDKLALSNPSIFAKVVSSTTRKKRAGEVGGVDFHYLSQQEMRAALARGEFIEYVKIRSRGAKRDIAELRKKALTQQASLQTMPSIPSPSPSPPPPPPPLLRAETDVDKKYGSLFDLTEEDSPVLSGEFFGTTHQSMTAAIQQGKPCVLLNVSSRGAQQLRGAGLQAAFIHIQRGTPKSTRPAGQADGGNDSPKSRSSTAITPDLIISSASLDQAYSELRDYAFQLVSSLKLASTSQYQVAQFEWENTPTVQFEQLQAVPGKKLVEVTFSEMVAHLQGPSLKHEKDRAKAEYGRSSLFSFGKLSKKLQGERLMVQALTFCEVSEKDRLHLRLLQTLYCKLTGKALACRRFGSHWQEIGFTGVDPADDLHQVGLLGPIQLLAFLEMPSTAALCKEIFQYCHKDTHVIPFVLMAFEFSQVSLQALNSGVLDKLCNKRDQVFVVLNEFYFAALHYYYQQWRASQKSILQLGLLMQQSGDYCKAHPRQLMQDFDKFLSSQNPERQLLADISTELQGTFTPFDNIKMST